MAATPVLCGGSTALCSGNALLAMAMPAPQRHGATPAHGENFADEKKQPLLPEENNPTILFPH